MSDMIYIQVSEFAKFRLPDRISEHKACLGLPVFQSSGSWGWSSPSGLGIVMVIIFWLGVWLCLGYLVERLVKR